MMLPFAVTPGLRAVVMALALGASFGAGWAVNGWRIGNASKSAEIRAKGREVEAIGEVRASEALIASTGQKIAVAALDRLRQESGLRAGREKAIVEVVKVPVYRQCIVTGDGLHVINQAVAAANAYTGELGRTRK